MLGVIRSTMIVSLVTVMNQMWWIITGGEPVVMRSRYIIKNAYALSTPSVVGRTVIFPCRFLNSCGSRHISVSVTSWLTLHYFDHVTSHRKTFLTWWPWPLTYDLDLRTWARYPSTWPTCQNAGLYVCPFGRESETDRQNHTQCQNYYTRRWRWE